MASSLTAFVVGGVAWAVQSPVDGGGVIHGCYAATTGAVSLDVKGACPIKGKSTPITWNAKGQPGVPGAPGAPGVPGAPGAQGPAGPGAIYIADTTNGTGHGPDDVLAANVGGFKVSVTCNTLDQFFDITTRWVGSDPNVGQVSVFRTQSSNGSPPATETRSGSSLGGGISLSSIGTTFILGTHRETAQGFVVANSGGIASQPEAGFWFSLYFEASLFVTPGTGSCNVTGVLVPISGNRSVPLPFQVP